MSARGTWETIPPSVPPATEPTNWRLVNESKTVRALVLSTPFGFIAVVRTGCGGPFRYYQTAQEWAENNQDNANATVTQASQWLR